MHHFFTRPHGWLHVLLMTWGLWALVGQPQPSQAATLLVTNVNDSGAGSLRQTIADAKPHDIIAFAAAVSGSTIVLTSGPIVLNMPLTIDGSMLAMVPTISGNQAKGIFSLSNSSVITLTRLTLSNGKSNYGGAIYNGGTLILNQVTLFDNDALNGGALYNVGSATLLNSTVSGNSAYSGGGIDNYGQLILKNSTLAGNSAVNTGGALFNAGVLQLYNTILADSSGDVDCHNADDPFFGLFGVINANVRSLAEDGSCATAFRGDPQLDPVALVDGVLVQPLAAASPAIDAGDAAACLPVDQRLAARPQGNGCDLGAVERITNPPAPTPTLTPRPTATATPTPSPTTTIDPNSPTATPTPSPSVPPITPTNGPGATAAPTPTPHLLYLPAIKRADSGFTIHRPSFTS